MGDREAKRALFDEFARAAKALASGRRIELVDVLANGERTVEALAAEVGLSVANARQQLQLPCRPPPRRIQRRRCGRRPGPLGGSFRGRDYQIHRRP